MDKSCPYNPNYGNCLKENCPGNSSTICTGAIAGQNACGENCKKCCDDSCPAGSKNYTGSFASKTECGNNCYNCNTACPSGSLAYSGDIVSYNECGQTCRSCNTSCPSGTSTSNPGGCGGSTSDECNTKTCYYPFKLVATIPAKATRADNAPAVTANGRLPTAAATPATIAAATCLIAFPTARKIQEAPRSD